MQILLTLLLSLSTIVATPEPQKEVVSFEQYGVRHLHELNEYRASNNLPAVELEYAICQKAKERADYLSENQLFDHNGFYAKADEYRYHNDRTFVGENLALDVKDEELISRWDGSPTHQKVMQNDRFKVGCIQRTNRVVVLWLAN